MKTFLKSLDNKFASILENVHYDLQTDWSAFPSDNESYIKELESFVLNNNTLSVN